MTIHEAVDQFFAWGVHRYTQRTLIIYTQICRQFAKHTRDVDVEQVTVMDHILPYSQKLTRAGKSETTANLHLIAIRQLWKFCERVLADHYDLQLKMRHDAIPIRGRIRPRHHKPLTEHEWQLLRGTFARKTLADIRDEALLTLLHDTGMRVSELVALNVDDIDLDRREVLAITRKRRDAAGYRSIPFTPKTERILRGWLPILATLHKRNEHALFVGLRGTGRLTTRQVERIFHTRCRAVSITGKTPHSMRHAFAQRLASAQMYQPYLQQLLGHSSPASSQVYYNIKNDDVHKAYDRATDVA